MPRWTDLATWRGPTANHGGPMIEQRGLVIHISEGGYEGTITWQKNPAAQVSSHFITDHDGTTAQMIDTDITAWTQQAGNGHWLSVENAGHTPGTLTAAQCEAIAQLFARGHQTYGWPLQLADGPTGRGLGHHSMGGTAWGHLDCPGPAIIAQKPAILARAQQIINPTTNPEEEDPMKIAVLVEPSGTCHLWWLSDTGPWYMTIDRAAVLDGLRTACGNPPSIDVATVDITAGRWGRQYTLTSPTTPTTPAGFEITLTGTANPTA